MLRSAFAVLVALAISACAGQSSVVPGTHGIGGRQVPVKLTVRIPRAAASETHSRRYYIAATTESVALTITTPTGASVLSTTFNVTATSNGCTTSSSVTTCTESFSLAPANYVASVATYDGMDGGGNELSEGQQIAFTVEMGVANQISLTLYGIPHAITISGVSRTIGGNASAGFTLYGSGTQDFSVTASDADGNTIVGAGAPAFTVSVGSSSIGVTQPTAGEQNEFELAQSSTVYPGVTLDVAASFSDSTVCQQSGAVCSTSTTVAALAHMVAAIASGALEIFDAPYSTTPTLTVTASPSPLVGPVFDGAGDIFESYYNSSTSTSGIYVYKPPYTGSPTVVSLAAGVTVGSLFADGANRLFVGGQTTSSGSNGYFAEIAPPYTSATTLTTTIECACSVVENAAGDVFAATHNACGASSCYRLNEFAPPYTGGPTQVGRGLPGAYGYLAMTPSQTLVGFFVNTSEGYADVFESPYSSTTSSLELGTPYCCNTNEIAGLNTWAVSDSNGNIYVPSSVNGMLYEYTPPYTSDPASIVSVGSNTEVAIDGSDDLFIGSSNGVGEYAPPYGSATFSFGIGGTRNFAVTP